MAKPTAAEWPQKVQQGYAFDGPALDLGALVVDGTTAPDAQVKIPLGTLNRHGLIAGATGTGKTKTLQLIAEQLSAAGVPVFLADMKGDLSGVAAPGVANDKLTKRAEEVGGTWEPAGCPVEFYALGGKGLGTPIRATMTAFGPMLLSKVLGLNDVQSSSLNLVFHYADKQGLPLLDVKDLQAVLKYLTSDEGKQELKDIGGLSAQTAGVILRELITFGDSGADVFFGEPEFDTADLLKVTDDGKGVVSCLELPDVASQPALFSTFLMWMLADLYHDLPEVGDVDKPKLVFFLDEAHLLFDGASDEFVDSITQTVRLIRSKGVGVFFITQTPKDVHPDVLAQLGNRVQHALRAYTPDDAKALKATVSTFPASPYDLEETLTQLGIGEAIVTVLSETGAPTPVAWTRLRPPRSLMGQLDQAEQQKLVDASPAMAEYGKAVDRESAYEKLAAARSDEVAAEPAAAEAAPAGRPAKQAAAKPRAQASSGRGRQAAAAGAAGGAAGMIGGLLGSPAFKSFARSAASAASREIARSLFGTAPRRRRR